MSIVDLNRGFIPFSPFSVFVHAHNFSNIYTEQMDAEGLGRRLLLTPLGTPPKVPEKQTVGTVTASHKLLSLQALLSSLNAGTAKRGFLCQGKAFG